MPLKGQKKISLINRTKEKAIELAETVNENVREIVQVYNFEDKTFKMAVEESDIIINTTSVGMTPDVGKSPISGDYFNDYLDLFMM